MNIAPSRVLAVALILATGWSLGRAAGDEGAAAAPAAPTSVALIDMARVFKESPRLTRLRDELRRDFEAESSGLKTLAEELKALKAEFDAAEKGGREQRELAKRFQEKTAEAQAASGRLRADFAGREAEVFRAFHDDVRAEIERLAKERGYGLVMRTQTDDPPSGFSAEPDAKQDVQKTVSRLNQLVLYHDGLDVTDAVIDRMAAAGLY